MLNIQELSSESLKNYLPELIDLLRDSVNNGASIGFLPPLSESDAETYWHDVIPQAGSPSLVVLCAFLDGQLVGTVQLGLETRANGNHRAEVKKLMVHSNYRRQGIAEKIMDAVDLVAHNSNLTLLVLDTRAGDPSDALYRKCGYTEAGRIPQYARSADGTLHETVFFYKLLT